MTPNFTQNNVRNSSLVYAKSFSEFFLGVFTSTIKFTNSYNLLCFKFPTPKREIGFKSMMYVLGISTPLKISNRVITSVTVFVVDTREIFRIFKESFGNESMHQKLFWVSTTVQNQTFVALTYLKNFKAFFLPMAPYETPFVGRIKSLVAFYRFHTSIIPLGYPYTQVNLPTSNI